MANEELPKLLRAIAASERGQEQRHDIIFNAAAAEIERLRLALREAREAINDYGLDDFEATTHETLAKIDAVLEK